MKKVKQTQDIEQRRSRQSSNFDNYQSFALGSHKRFVNLTIPQITMKGKQSYKKQPYCVLCFRNFTTTFRQHHCRICANATCGDCSRSLVNKERTCDLCVMKVTNPQEEKKKKEMLETLETLCAFLLFRKKLKMQELQTLKDTDISDRERFKDEIGKQEKMITELQKENQALKVQKEVAQKQMDQIRLQNSQLEESISQIQNDITGLSSF